MHPLEGARVDSALTQHAITVLLVDDQAMVAEAVRRMLVAERDITFFYCQDPTKAIQMAGEIRPTVILQDLVMPEIDGLTLVRFFRAHPKLRDVPLIVLSSKEEATTKAEAFALGANDYLVKLPDRIELIARIRYHSKAYINLLQRNEAFEALVKSQQTLSAQIARAAEYVTSLLPEPIKQGPITTTWQFVPSAALGGDSFGYHWIDDDHFAIYLLDVCDHGVGPALLSVSALNVLRSQSLPNTDFREPGRVLTALNDAFQMENQNDLYFTIWYGVFKKSACDIKYASAGHPPALLITESGEVAELKTPNLMIGGMPGIEYESGSIGVSLPSRLYIYSDGVYEVIKPDGEMWSFEEFKDHLLDMKATGSEMDGLYEYVKAMNAGNTLDDDFSMLQAFFR
jgi:phosphoserine phosphatase RsbU/P